MPNTLPFDVRVNHNSKKVKPTSRRSHRLTGEPTYNRMFMVFITLCNGILFNFQLYLEIDLNHLFYYMRITFTGFGS